MSRRCGFVALVLSWIWMRPIGAETISYEQFGAIGIYSIIEKGLVIAPELSEFVAGYLGNVKNYTVHNLDEIVAKRRATPEVEARRKASRFNADGLLEVRLVSFDSKAGQGEMVLQLLDTTGRRLTKWKAAFEVPYFDPPWYQQARPYGTLDQVFAQWPERNYRVERTLRMLVVTDQPLDAAGGAAKAYLMDQVNIASRVFEREFGLSLKVVQVEHWQPPYEDLVAVARAAVQLASRNEVDLTLVSLGPPAPLTYWAGGEHGTVGYARVLTNLFVSRITNAHVFIHEIAHVLGAIHLAEKGWIMQPVLERQQLARRFKVLPNIQFHPANRRIIDLTRLLPLGARYTDHQDKLDRLMLVYEELQETHLKEVAPYYAEVLMNVDRNDEAIELLQRAIKSHPSGIGLRPRLVEALHKEGRYAEAQRLVQAEFERYQEGIKERTGGALRLADEPLMRLSVGRVFFGKLVVGTDQTKKVTVSNLGTSMLEISRITSPLKPFSFVGGPVGSAWVEPGETLELMVRFKPPKSGSYHSSFDILSNTSGKAIQSVMLKGWGGD